MKKVATQFGTVATADFEEMTWTFEMPENFKVWAGEFAIVDKPVYDELLEALGNLIQNIESLDETSELPIMKILISKGKEAIKKATEC